MGVNKNGSRIPVIIIEPMPGKMPRTNSHREGFIKELFAIGKQNELTKDIKTILFHPSFPVDIRHNAKIFREKLAVWARKQL